MKIETLPLLSSDFSTWTWWGTNGEASESLTNLSYLALKNKDLCSKFIREVWNDLVRLLNNALTTAGFQWDSTYGDLDSTLFDTSLRINREFKASMFNAVVLNINQLGIFCWNWERNNNIPGFLGRTYMKGYSEYGSNSDFIYGWYILELAEKLNVFIRVLKDEAPFIEREFLGKSQMYNTAVAVSRKAEIIESAIKVEGFHIAPLAKVRIVENSSINSECSYHKGIIVPRSPVILPESLQRSGSHVKASTIKVKVQDYETNAYADTFSESILKGVPFISRMIYQKPIQAKYLAGVDVFNIQEFSYVEKAITKLTASLKNAMPYLLNMSGDVKSYSDVELKIAERMLLSGVPKSEGYAMSEMILRNRKIMSSINTSLSVQVSTMSYIVPLYMQRKIQAKSYYLDEMNTVVPMPICKMENVVTYVDVAGGAYEVLHIENNLYSDSYDESSVNAVQIKHINPYAVKAEDLSVGALNIVQGVFTESSKKVQSYSDAEILKGIPVQTESCSEERSSESSELKKMTGEPITYAGTFGEIIAAELAGNHASALGSKYRAYSKTVCMLELESTKETWYDPVQNGTDLYVRNAYPQWKEDTNVHIDSGGVFYEAEQTGINVYIRSAESMKGVIDNG